MFRGLALCAALLGSACGGGIGGLGGQGSECRDSADCRGDLECAGPSQPQVCGIGPNEQCIADADCGPDLRCHVIWDACSPDGVGSECRTPCSDGTCGEAFRCGATGACEVIPCDETDACPSYQMCDPTVATEGPVHARAAGCVAISCADDDACPPATACVNGVCQEGPGTCVEVMAVP